MNFDKANLKDHTGCTLKEFKKTLKARWVTVWTELLSGHLALIICILLTIKLEHIRSFLLPFVIIFSAFIFGFIHAYIQLFFHEAVHGNIVKNRKLNDFLANLLIGIFIGQDVKIYRSIHFIHHQKHGTIEDSEHTYFDPLNMRFIISALTGIKVMKVLLSRKNTLNTSSKTSRNYKQLFLGISLHAVLLSWAILSGHFVLALSWVIGMGIVMPFFGAVRQVLEHRDFNAKNDLDYYTIPHGPTNRLFGDSLLARIFGAAGFNRHLIHHWEPQVSYTQLPALEKFLLKTEAADWIRSHQTTYTATFLQLIRTS